MAVVSSAGKFEIDGSDQYEGGYIVDLSLNVDILSGTTAQVKLVNEKGEYTTPTLGTQPRHSIIIEIFSATDSSVFSTDFLPIESNETNGPGGKFMQVSFVEAGPALVRKIPVEIRGRMTAEKSTSFNMLINVGAKYFTSPGQDGGLIKASDLGKSQRDKLDDDVFLAAREAEAPPIFLFTAAELMQAIHDLGLPYTENFNNFMRYGMAGQYFENGGNLATVLQEITQRAGNQWYWNGYGSDVASVTLTGQGTHGLDIFVSAADIAEVIEELAEDNVVLGEDDEIVAVQDDSQLLSSSITRSLRGTSAMGVTYALHVSPTHPANINRGQEQCENLSAASKKQKTVNCKDEDTELAESFYRDDGSRKDPAGNEEKILGYCRLVNAIRMGEEFFRMYVYMKLVGYQRLSKAPLDAPRNTNASYKTAWAWLNQGNKTDEPTVTRNLIVEQLFLDCIYAAAPMRNSNDVVTAYPDANADDAKPWSKAGLVSDIFNNLIDTSEEKSDWMKGGTMVTYIHHVDPEKEDNLLNSKAVSETYRSIKQAISDASVNTYLIGGEGHVVCGPKKEEPKNYVTFTWSVGTKFYAPFPVQETNPFAIASDEDVFYTLARGMATKADWKTAVNDPDFRGFNFATLVAFIRGDFKTIREAWDTLNCPAQEKDAIKAQDDDDDEWACGTQHTELMPNGKIAWGQTGGLEDFDDGQRSRTGVGEKICDWR